jgi:hypothetical protein
MRTCNLWIQPWKLKTRWAFLCLHNDISISYYLMSLLVMCSGTMVMMWIWEIGFLWPLQQMGCGYTVHKTDFGVQAHQSTTSGSLEAQHYFRKSITFPSRMRLSCMSTRYKLWNGSSPTSISHRQSHQIPLHVVVVVSAKCSGITWS